MLEARLLSLASANRAVEAWLTAPVANAAGRAGLFRIVFGLFYLWEIARYHAIDIALWPGMKHRVLGVGWFPDDAPATFFVTLESVVVASLVLLIVGYRTRWATALVLVAGTLLEAFFVELDTRNSTVLLVFFIPLFMGIAGNWGDTYSLDARIQRERAGAAVAPSTQDGLYFMPARAVLVVLSILFLSGSLLKMLDGGTWLSYPRIMPDLLLRAQVENAMAGLPLNPIARVVSETPWLHPLLRYGTVAFEGLFWLALFGPRLRAWFVALALVFHSVNAIWVNVTFSPILVVYLMLVDWESLYQRLPRWRGALGCVPAGGLVAGALIVAPAAGVLWQTSSGLRGVVSLGGLLTEVTIWYPVLPVALVLLVLSSYRLIAGLVTRTPGRRISP